MSGEIKRNSGMQDWQATMRAAMFDGINQADMAQIIKSVTSKAKQGDLKAADFLFRWILGTPSPVVHVQQTHNVYREDQPVIDVRPKPFPEHGDDPPPEEIERQKREIRLTRNGKS